MNEKPASGTGGIKMRIASMDRSALAFYALVAAGIVVCVLTELEKVFPAIETICGGSGSGCSAVRSTKYSSMLGVSLGIWGILSYLLWAGVYRISRPWAGIFGGAVLGAELYFVYLQIYVIKAICILCMIQFSVVALLNLLLLITAYRSKKQFLWKLYFIPVAAVAFLALYLPMKAQAQSEWAKEESITSWGDPKSEYRVEVFSDYQCPHCKQFDPVVQKVIQNYPEIYVIFRDYIIVGHNLSPMAVAYAGSVAYTQGKEMYLKTHFELFDKQENLFQVLKERLPSMKEDKVMEAAVNEKVKRDRERADMLGIKGTPAMALVKNGEVVHLFSGYLPFEKIKPEIDRFTGRPVR